MKPAQWFGRCLAGALLLATTRMLPGCTATLPELPHPEHRLTLGGDEVLLVGRVQFMPPPHPAEQDLDVIGSLGKPLQFHALLNDAPVPVAVTPWATPRTGQFTSRLGESFYVRHPRRAIHVTGLYVYLRLTRMAEERVWLPGGLIVDVQPEDRAVYLGTVRYRRNAYFDVRRVEIVDEFAREEARFRASFGEQIALRRRLARPSGAPVSARPPVPGVEVFEPLPRGPNRSGFGLPP